MLQLEEGKEVDLNLTAGTRCCCCCCCYTHLLQRHHVEGESSVSEHGLKLSHLHPSVLCTLTYSATLWDSKHTTFSKGFAMAVKENTCF